MLVLQQQLTSIKNEKLHEELGTEEINDLKSKLQYQVIFNLLVFTLFHAKLDFNA